METKGTNPLIIDDQSLIFLPSVKIKVFEENNFFSHKDICLEYAVYSSAKTAGKKS